MSKKTIYILVGAAVAIIGLLIVLSKSGVIGNKDKGTSVEIANVNTSTIVEPFQQLGKFNPKLK
jgi:HlyD family secretion protein